MYLWGYGSSNVNFVPQEHTIPYQIKTQRSSKTDISEPLQQSSEQQYLELSGCLLPLVMEETN